MNQIYDLIEAANNNDRVAQFNLSKHYLTGDGVPIDFDKAIDLIKLSAKNGYALAQFELSSLYEHGVWGLLNQDESQAFYWCELAAQQGIVDAEFNLGYYYENGFGTLRNFELAFEWYTKAANKGYPKAAYNLGVYYYNGLGVVRNVDKAGYYFFLAAQCDIADAKEMLAKCMMDGYISFEEY